MLQYNYMVNHEPGSSSATPFVERTVAPEGLDEILAGFDDAEVRTGDDTYTEQVGGLKSISDSIDVPPAAGTEAFNKQFTAEIAKFKAIKDLIATISPETPLEPTTAQPEKYDDKATTTTVEIGRAATQEVAELVPETQPEPTITSAEHEESSDSTKVAEPKLTLKTPHATEASQPRTLETFVKEVAPHELLRKPDSNHSVDPAYLEKHTAARHMLVEAMVDGTLYLSTERFTQTIQQAHALITAPSRDKQSSQENEGPFRPAGKRTEHKKSVALEVAEIAKKYNDPYAAQFEQPNTRTVSTVKLVGIERQFRPVDIAAKNGRYTFEFPTSEAIPQYMGRFTQLGKVIQQELAKPEPDTKRAIGLIGTQYQYAAALSPFLHNNNPVFMNLANTQLKMLGLNGITHGIMDHAARRLQPNAFVQYFADRVNNRIG